MPRTTPAQPSLSSLRVRLVYAAPGRPAVKNLLILDLEAVLNVDDVQLPAEAEATSIQHATS